jgi:hypothetical protein
VEKRTKEMVKENMSIINNLLFIGYEAQQARYRQITEQAS